MRELKKFPSIDQSNKLRQVPHCNPENKLRHATPRKTSSREALVTADN